MTDLSLFNGLIGGIATVVMTGFMMLFGDDSPPPTALFWSKYVGAGKPSDYVPQGMALHMLYGIGAGAAFALVISLSGLGLTGAVGMIGLGLAWGFLLFAGAALFWMRMVLGMEPEPEMVGLFLVFHLIYGGVLGVWLSLGLF